MNRTLQHALLVTYRAVAATGILGRGPGRRLVETAYLGYKRFFEAGSPKRLAPYIREGSTVVDVGANIGFFTVPFARWVGPEGRVIALEPEAANHDRLRSRVAAAGLADRALLLEAAAADRSGRLRLAINPNHPGDHKLADEDMQGGIDIAAHALDDLIAAHPGPPVSLIKIDVQGAEFRVITGAMDVIARDRPTLLVEIDPGVTDAAGTSAAAQLLGLLGERGYDFHSWSRHGAGERQAAEAIIAAAQTAGYLDVLCIHDGD